MGVIVGIIVLGALVASLAAAPLLAYRGAVRVLGRERARASAYALLAIPAVVGSGFVLLWWLTGAQFDPRFAILAAAATATAVASAAERAVRLTGGPREASPSEERLHARLTSALASLERMDLAAWRDALEAAAEEPAVAGPRLADSIRAVLRTEAAAPGMPELRDRRADLDRAIHARWPAPAWVRRVAGVAAFATLIGTFGWVTATGVIARQACIGAEEPSGRPATVEIETSGPIADSLLADPEPDAQLLLDLPLNLVEAAETRADPDARDDLEQAGFVQGHYRSWTAADGRMIHADAFEFRDQAGALEYQRRVHRYACDAANMHFDAPHGGVGLQTRYRNGDPIVEQISWVAGNRRYLVSVRHLEPPPDHSRILAIYHRALGG